jgi:AraC-like DNA-binding protein
MGFTALFSFTATIIGALLTTVILYRHKETSARYLAFFLFTLTSSNFFFFLFESSYFLQVPFLLRVGPLVNFLIAPSLFFYTVFAINKKKKLRWWDLLHLLPAFIFLVDYFPLFISNNNHKKQIIEALLHNMPQALIYGEGGLISLATYRLLRHLVALLYVAYLWFLVKNCSRSNEGKIVQNRTMLSWLKILLILFFLFSITGVATSIFSYAYDTWVTSVGESLMVFAALCFVLIFKSSVLYGPYVGSVTEFQGEKYKHITLRENTVLEVQAKLGEFLKHQQFLRKGIRLKEVADEFGVPSYILSAYINRGFHLRFNDFINWYRIQYIKEGLTDQQWNLLTLEAISKKAGFNNRTTFLSAFKKFTGMTPTAFLHSQKKGEGLKAKHNYIDKQGN